MLKSIVLMIFLSVLIYALAWLCCFLGGFFVGFFGSDGIGGRGGDAGDLTQGCSTTELYPPK